MENSPIKSAMIIIIIIYIYKNEIKDKIKE